MRILKLAWRNVWRNARRSSVTIAAMTIALVIELLYSGLISGMMIGMEDNAISLDTGDIQVTTPDYLTRPSLYEVVEDQPEKVGALEADGYRVTRRLYSGGLAASGDSSAGVAFVGLDPENDAKVLDLHRYVGEGAWLDASDPLGVVIGRGLARTLGVGLGSEIVVLSQGTDGSMANELFQVRGIMMTVAASIDRRTILMNEQTFRDLLVLPEGSHKLIVRRPVNSELVQAGDALRATFGLPPAAEQSAVEL
ncbi:MAG: ABC transporter permease, partial [Myxococcota bacterium]